MERRVDRNIGRGCLYYIVVTEGYVIEMVRICIMYVSTVIIWRQFMGYGFLRVVLKNSECVFQGD